jgi:hypothetical protein
VCSRPRRRAAAPRRGRARWSSASSAGSTSTRWSSSAVCPLARDSAATLFGQLGGARFVHRREHAVRARGRFRRAPGRKGGARGVGRPSRACAAVEDASPSAKGRPVAGLTAAPGPRRPSTLAVGEPGWRCTMDWAGAAASRDGMSYPTYKKGHREIEDGVAAWPEIRRSRSPSRVRERASGAFGGAAQHGRSMPGPGGEAERRPLAWSRTPAGPFPLLRPCLTRRRSRAPNPRGCCGPATPPRVRDGTVRTAMGPAKRGWRRAGGAGRTHARRLAGWVGDDRRARLESPPVLRTQVRNHRRLVDHLR